MPGAVIHITKLSRCPRMGAWVAGRATRHVATPRQVLTDLPPFRPVGAVHLLWHGIFAFKIDANRGRTDLVFGEPLGDQETYADALVLTEWKKATKSDASKKFGEATSQAEIYARGPLAGNELHAYRYAVVVTDK